MPQGHGGGTDGLASGRPVPQAGRGLCTRKAASGACRGRTSTSPQTRPCVARSVAGTSCQVPWVSSRPERGTPAHQAALGCSVC
jgi:hypothetical protein